MRCSAIAGTPEGRQSKGMQSAASVDDVIANSRAHPGIPEALDVFRDLRDCALFALRRKESGDLVGHEHEFLDLHNGYACGPPSAT